MSTMVGRVPATAAHICDPCQHNCSALSRHNASLTSAARPVDTPSVVRIYRPWRRRCRSAGGAARSVRADVSCYVTDSDLWEPDTRISELDV